MDIIDVIAREGRQWLFSSDPNGRIDSHKDNFEFRFKRFAI